MRKLQSAQGVCDLGVPRVGGAGLQAVPSQGGGTGPAAVLRDGEVRRADLLTAVQIRAEVARQDRLRVGVEVDVQRQNIGVDIDNLYISQPDNGEQALEITETMVRKY